MNLCHSLKFSFRLATGHNSNEQVDAEFPRRQRTVGDAVISDARFTGCASGNFDPDGSFGPACGVQFHHEAVARPNFVMPPRMMRDEAG